MKNTSLSKKIFIGLLLWSSLSSATGLNYSELKMRDYDEMSDDVKKNVLSAEKKASKDDLDGARAELELAVLLILSRPENSDNMVAKLLPIVRTPLKNIGAFQSVLNEVVTDAIDTAKDKKAKPTEVVTSLIIIENFMGELKPDVKNDEKIKNIFAKIRDAKISVRDDVKTELKMRAMITRKLDPSATAKGIIGGGK